MKGKSFLTINFGAGTLRVAEFEGLDGSVLGLRDYRIIPLGMEGSIEARRPVALEKALAEALESGDFVSTKANICAPGFQVFSKLVKFPPVDTSKVTQLIQYEAQQNIPFPLEEVAWDYQIVGTSAKGELEVLLVAIKTDLVDGLMKICETNGLTVDCVDVSPAALANAFRYNYSDIEGASMVLDIGSKTSNVIICEGDKFYSRSVNIGADNITRDFASEAKMRFPEAEQLKVDVGLVGLGGAYAEPEDPNQAAISKIARQVMTRLHLQVNQTIQFYTKQQGGSTPSQVYLAGGGSTLPYSVEFFAEKLGTHVEYFNPVRNVQVDPAIDLEGLAGVAHGLGENVGSALRNIASCPVEVNLTPKASLQKQEFKKKQPYLVASGALIVAILLAFGAFQGQIAASQRSLAADIQQEIEPLDTKDRQLNQVIGDITETTNKVSRIAGFMNDRRYWAEMLTQLRDALTEAEARFEGKGGAVGIWVETLDAGEFPTTFEAMQFRDDDDDDTSTGTTQQQGGTMWTPEMMALYGYGPGMMPGMEGGMPGMPGGMPGAFGNLSTPEEEDVENGLSKISLSLRAINRHKIDGARGNTELAHTVLEAIKSREMFDAEETKLADGQLRVDPEDLTFPFEVRVTLANPLMFGEE